MHCTRAEAVLDAYLDGELEPAAAGELETHLAACAECEARVRAERQVRERLARALAATEPLPAALRERIESLVRRRGSEEPVGAPAVPGAVPELGPARDPRPVPDPTGPPEGVRLVRWTRRSAAGDRRLRLGLAVAAVLAGVALLWTLLPRAGLADAWAAGLAADHRGGHGPSGRQALVVESDPDELTGWFEQRLGIELALPDAPPGAQLVGGQICPVNERRVAHAVYDVGGLTVSVYLVPEGRGGEEPEDGRSGELNYRAWPGDSRTTFAMGKVPPQELVRFAPE